MARPKKITTRIREVLGLIPRNDNKPEIFDSCVKCPIFEAFLSEMKRIWKLEEESMREVSDTPQMVDMSSWMAQYYDPRMWKQFAKQLEGMR